MPSKGQHPRGPDHITTRIIILFFIFYFFFLMLFPFLQNIATSCFNRKKKKKKLVLNVDVYIDLSRFCIGLVSCFRYFGYVCVECHRMWISCSQILCLNLYFKRQNCKFGPCGMSKIGCLVQKVLGLHRWSKMFDLLWNWSKGLTAVCALRLCESIFVNSRPFF